MKAKEILKEIMQDSASVEDLKLRLDGSICYPATPGVLPLETRISPPMEVTRQSIGIAHRHSCHICSIGSRFSTLLPINTSDNVFTAFQTVALRTSDLLVIRVFQLDAVERAARSFRSLTKRQKQASGMFY